MNDFVAAINSVYLLGHPEFARAARARWRAERRARTVLVLAIKPKYAKAIYDGRKHWEFRKAPPPLFREMYVYESAPISAVTGTIAFSESVTGMPMMVWDIVRTNKCFARNLTGISFPELKAYAGTHPVTALRVFAPKRFDKPVKFGPRPPQNWGKYILPRAAAETAESEAANG